MTSPLPAGVRLWIWPRYVIEVDGTKVKLGRTQGRLLAILIMGRDKLWTVDEIICALYGDHEDGGPLYARKLVYTRTSRLIDRLAKRGIALELEIRGHTRRLSRIYALPAALIVPAAEQPLPVEPTDPEPSPRSLPLPRIYRSPWMRHVMSEQPTDRQRFMISKFRQPLPPKPPRRKRVRLVKWAEFEAEPRPIYASPHDAPWTFPERVEVSGSGGWKPTPHSKHER